MFSDCLLFSLFQRMRQGKCTVVQIGRLLALFFYANLIPDLKYILVVRFAEQDAAFDVVGIGARELPERRLPYPYYDLRPRHGGLRWLARVLVKCGQRPGAS
jgi:hypothetical protein